MRWTFVVLFYTVRVLADPYPYTWNIGDVTLTCNLGFPGWKQAGTSCFFPFSTRTQTWYDANQMCRNYVFGHSQGTLLQNWLVARTLPNSVPKAVYWTGFRTSDNPNELQIGWDPIKVSIYNPLWASDQPQLGHYKNECVALDLRSERTMGWRIYNCTELLPILCETFACLESEFRCADNSRCIPQTAVNDGTIDCGDGSDESRLESFLISTANTKNVTSGKAGCKQVLLTSLDGWLFSPNYPLNYSENVYCSWTIAAPRNYAIIIIAEEVEIGSKDHLVAIDGSEMSFTEAIAASPFISKSNVVNMVFASTPHGGGRGFAMHYHIREKVEKCPPDHPVNVQTWSHGYICSYNFTHTDQDAYTVLEILSFPRSDNTIIVVSYGSLTHVHSITSRQEFVVVPSNSVRILVQTVHAKILLSVLYLRKDDLVVAPRYDGFAIEWLTSANETCKNHSLKFIVHNLNITKEISAKTLAVDKVVLANDDLSHTYNDGSPVRSASVMSHRVILSNETLRLSFDQRSAIYAVSLRFSQDCPPIVAPTGVTFELTARNEVGSTARFSCIDVDSILYGPHFSECLVGGEWSADPPTCSGKSLQFCLLPIVENGYVLNVKSPPSSNYSNGTLLIFACNFGYTLISSTSVCIDGRWIPFPSCTRGLCRFPESTYKEANLKDKKEQRITILSRANYVSPWWSAEIKPFRVCFTNCEESRLVWSDFNFNFYVPLCTAYAVKNGHFEKRYYKHLENATIICNNGYSNEMKPQCIYGAWSISNATCTDIDECHQELYPCDPDAYCKNLQGGFTCICPKGKALYTNQTDVGNSYLISGVSCIWLICALKDLPYSKEVIPIIKEERYRHNGTATLLCPIDSNSFAEFKVKCIAGVWNSTKNPCEEKCYKPRDSKGVNYGVNAANLFQNTSVSCLNEEHILIGSEKVLCGRGGHWLSEPICKDIHCPDLSGLIRGTLYIKNSTKADKYVVGSSIYFGCSKGYLMGAEKITCEKVARYNARWSASPPSCVSTNATMNTVNGNFEYEEAIISAPQFKWMHSSDWMQFNSTWIGFASTNFPSFLVSPPIAVKSDSVKLLLDIQRLGGTLTISVYSSDSVEFSSLNKFNVVSSASTPGLYEVPLTYLKTFLRLSLQKSASVTIQSMKLLYGQCQATSLDGISLSKSYTFSKPRQLTAICESGRSGMVTVTAVCRPVTGWWLQQPNPCCQQCSVVEKSDSVECTYKDCDNGRCIISQGKKLCDCNPDFYYDGIACVPDSCKHSFCAGFSNCIELNGSAKCCCRMGFEGSYFCERKSTYCIDCPANHEIAFVLSEGSDTVEPQCICAENGILGKCPLDPCTNNICRHGNCIANSSFSLGYYCECDEGWLGQECDVKQSSGGKNMKRETVSHCETVTCIHGTCNPTEDGYMCYCFAGYTGKNCERKIDSSENCKEINPCQQGICTDSKEGLRCNCSYGWEGNRCEVPLKLCEKHNPCTNRGECRSDLPGRTLCECRNGYGGEHCENAVMYCPLMPCFNGGTCEENIKGYKCLCPPGTSGSNCEFLSNPCLFFNCYNGGTCVVKDGEPLCRCLDGFFGEHCEHKDPCLNYACENGGTCVRVDSLPHCKCPANTTGDHCEIFVCTDGYCMNGGTCMVTNNTLHCKCPQHFMGEHCEISLCTDDYCLNGGTCTIVNNTLHCECTSYFKGDRCQTYSGPCAAVRCQNGGTCYDVGDKAVCKCAPNYAGPRCETFVDPCTNFECKNKGNCVIENQKAVCKCMRGYGGVHCEVEWKKCEEFPEPLVCLNSGTCIVLDHQMHCKCSIDFFGDTCEVFGRSCAVINCHTGTCINDTNLQGHCLCPPDYTGEFCETKKTHSYNLFFNGLPSTQKIVSRDFQSTFLREFTLCAWVFYAPEEKTPANLRLGPYLQLNTTTGAAILSLDNQFVTINDNFHVIVRMSLMAWHQICVRSPSHKAIDRPIWSVFLDGAIAANASYEMLSVDADIRCRLQLSPLENKRFRGEISLVQLYTVYLDDLDVAKMAFKCRDWTSLQHPDLQVKWNDFTTVQQNNPGVMALYPGLCEVSECLPGRPNCNTKDKIPPMVKSCPRNIRSISPSRLTRVEWDTSDMFVDNVGVTSVNSNYRSGQYFTWGYYRVIYTGSDAAGNTAFCSFSVVVAPAECQKPKADDQLEGKAFFAEVNGTDAMLRAQVQCSDTFYPRSDPEFYICDVMGQWDRSSLWPTNRTYSFPSCGRTTDPAQNITGSLSEYGNCTAIRQHIHDTLLNDLKPYCGNCTNEIQIDPMCRPEVGRNYRSIRDEWLEFNFYVNINNTRKLLKNTIETSIKKEFPNSTVDEDVQCNVTFPNLSKGLENASCADCPAGQYWNVDHCIECPVDSYRSKTDPLKECINCPENTTTAGLMGQKNRTACHDICYAGEFYDESERRCILCPLGTYQEKRGSSACVACPLDSTTTITGAKNATDCSFKCGSGQELTAERICTPCARGTYWVTSSKFTGCVKCPRGLTTTTTASTSIRDCDVVNCPPGTHVNMERSKTINPVDTTFESFCVTCEMGYYQDQRNQTECKKCTPESNCDLANSCSPLIADSCPKDETCEMGNTGVYACSSVVVEPTRNENKWVIWVIIPILAILIVVAAGVLFRIFRRTIGTLMCCTKFDLKNTESRNYYRSSLVPIIPRRREEDDEYRNYPPRNQVTCSHPLDLADAFGPRRIPRDPQSDLTSPKPRQNYLPPPIITSRAELDLLEEQARRRAAVTGTNSSPSRAVDSSIATGHSCESPGPSISAQIAASRSAVPVEPRPPLPLLAEDLSSSSSAAPWDSSLPDDDDEDYFG